MGKKLKRKPLSHHVAAWFIPHKRNDHRPHLIRLHGLAVVALLIIGVQVAANVASPASINVLAYASNINASDIFTLTNNERVANGLAPLRLEAKLNQSAALKAQNMFAENYWAHVSPSGLQPWHWFTLAGYNYSYAGENLAKDFDTTSGTVQGWMNSPGHRANILNPNYTDVGFAVQNGSLVGGETTLVVAHYGSVQGAAIAAAPATPKPAPKVAATPRPVVAVATPAPTPAPTETPAPTPSATPSPTPTITPVPLAKVLATPSVTGAPQSSLFLPLSLVRSLNMGTIVTIFLLIILLIVYVMTHVAVWRKGMKSWRSHHYRMYAAAEVSSVAIAIVLLAVSGIGSVG